MMLSKRWIAPLVVLAMWAFALAVYPRLPDRVPTHWSFGGEVDGWDGKWPGAFYLPAFGVLVAVLPYLLPYVDPRRRNLARFREEMHLVFNLVALFFAVMEALSLGYALGWAIDFTTTMLATVGVMLVGLGNYLPRLRSNWFMGIRTPWTMDSERVWRETHRVGGRTFVAGGLVMVLAAFLLPGDARTWVAMSACAVAALVPVVYSYLSWRRDAAREA
ncbi:MAG TPA: SdpI family protein [Longimicrobiaceae bacterium]|nr:SdpI family protein [Longimicrobiaceae bacterium]